MIAKIRYHRENLAIAKIENFAMHINFRYDSGNLAMIAKFRYLSEFFSVAKFWHCSSLLVTVPLLPATTHLIHVFLLSFPFSDILFF